MRPLCSCIAALLPLVFCVPVTAAQVITVEPPFPHEKGPVTIVFDATEGSGGLAGYTGDVYAQTAVITNKSEHPDYWRYMTTEWGQNTPDTKLERIGEDLYKLEIPNIRSYYSDNRTGAARIPASEEIQKLVFVFRSSDGSRDGRDLGAAVSASIYVDLFPPGVHVRLLQPVVGTNEGARVRMDTALSVVAVGGSVGRSLTGMRLLVDEEEVAQTTADTLAYALPYQPGREVLVRILAEDPNGEIASASFDVIYSSRVAAPKVLNETADQQARLLEPRFEPISLGGGATSTRVEAILQDRQGFLWIGTSNGLYRYDGYMLSVYQHDPDNPNSLSHNAIYAMVEDHAGRLWIGTEAGLNCFDPATEVFTRFLHDPDDSSSLSNDWVAAVYEDRGGILWVGTQAGLNRLDSSTGTFVHYKYDMNDSRSVGFSRVEAIYEDEVGILWIGSWGGGLSRFDHVTETFTRYLRASYNAHSLSNNFVQSIYEDRTGRLWIGTGGGLDRYDRETESFTHYSLETSNPTGLRTVHSVFEDARGMLWVGAYGGLHRVDPITGQTTHYQHDPGSLNSLRHSDVHTLFEDRSGVLWVGTSDGLSKVRRTPFASYKHNPDDLSSFSSGEVYALYEDYSGVRWVGTSDGLNRFDPETETFTLFKYHPDDSRVTRRDVFSLHEDYAGALWVGTFDGVKQFDREAETFISYPHRPVITPDQGYTVAELVKVVWSIYESPSQPGVFWVGTRTDLFRFDPYGSGDFIHYLLETTHPRGWHTVNTIYESTAEPGILWIGTLGGLNRFDVATGEVTHYRHDPNDLSSLSSDEVYVLHEDLGGILWVGTRDGLNRYDRETKTFTHITVQDGLPDQFVKGILGDDHGTLWISTGNGLSRFNPTTWSFRNYDARDGLQGDVFLQGAFHRNRRGELFFGGQDGFTLFHPDDVLDNPHVPPVVLSDFKVLGKSVGLDQPLEFTREIQLFSNQNSFSFEFAALDYTAPQQNQYAYKLEGFDKAWFESGTRRFARYPNVPPGTYVFRVRGSNSDGVWNEEGASVRVVVTPPFWRTGWFFTLGLVFALSLFVAVGYVVRARRLKLQARALQALVEERTRNLVAEKEKTEEQARRLVELDEAKNRFFANISHEFRTPLTLILGPLQDALSGVYKEDLSRLQEQLGLVHRNARRLLRLINQLLDLSKLDAGKREAHLREGDFLSFLQKLVQAFIAMAERKHIRLQFSTEIESLSFDFDADVLEKVFSNLLSNALKFTPEGGKVWVTVFLPEGETPGLVAVSVKDTGSGIAKEDQARIFDRFQQADTSSTRVHEGTGIGLALAKELVVLHEGTISVDSDPGFGSVFTVHLPLKNVTDRHHEPLGFGGDAAMLEEAAIQSVVVPASQRTTEDADDNKPTILIVEDNADVRVFLRSHLTADYHVLEAEDGEVGLRTAREANPALILADVMMPRMDGFEMCRLIKANDKLRSIPVVMLTAKAGEQDTLEGLGSGADDYIAKPFNMPELKARIANLITTRREMRSQFSREVVVQPTGITIQSQEEAFLNQLLDAINAHLGDSNFGVDWLADEMSLSRRQLERRIEAVVGETPAELIRRMRLERASQMLKSHAGTVSEIAYASGFNSASHFSKVFREVYGESPSQHMHATPVSDDV